MCGCASPSDEFTSLEDKREDSGFRHTPESGAFDPIGSGGNGRTVCSRHPEKHTGFDWSTSSSPLFSSSNPYFFPSSVLTNRLSNTHTQRERERDSDESLKGTRQRDEEGKEISGGRRRGETRKVVRPVDSGSERGWGTEWKKCDHSFNLMLSGVNKECVAGRRRGQDYRAPLYHKNTQRLGDFKRLNVSRRKDKPTRNRWILRTKLSLHPGENSPAKCGLSCIRSLCFLFFLLLRISCRRDVRRDGNNFNSHVKYAACGMCQRGLRELARRNIEQWVRVLSEEERKRRKKLERNAEFSSQLWSSLSALQWLIYSNQWRQAWGINARTKTDINAEVCMQLEAPVSHKDSPELSITSISVYWENFYLRSIPKKT